MISNRVSFPFNVLGVDRNSQSSLYLPKYMQSLKNLARVSFPVLITWVALRLSFLITTLRSSGRTPASCPTCNIRAQLRSSRGDMETARCAMASRTTGAHSPCAMYPMTQTPQPIPFACEEQLASEQGHCSPECQKVGTLVKPERFLTEIALDTCLASRIAAALSIAVGFDVLVGTRKHLYEALQ